MEKITEFTWLLTKKKKFTLGSENKNMMLNKWCKNPQALSFYQFVESIIWSNLTSYQWIQLIGLNIVMTESIEYNCAEYIEIINMNSIITCWFGFCPLDYDDSRNLCNKFCLILFLHENSIPSSNRKKKNLITFNRCISISFNLYAFIGQYFGECFT